MSTQFPYENLSDLDFEGLVIRICQDLLGIGCKTFSPGRDGAKDSWFSGTAQSFPSTTAPWNGTFIIQAKHTKIYNASCSDNDFSVNKSSIVDKEIARLNEIKTQTPFGNYLLFTNRKLSGEKVSIIQKLQKELGLNNVDIIGREQIDDYLNGNPFIAQQFGLEKFIAPLRFYEKDLRDVIVSFDAHREQLTSSTVVRGIDSNNYIEKEEKNRLNNLSKDYFDFILNNSLPYFEEIDKFLRDPKNAKYTRMYRNTVADLQEVITIERENYRKFDNVIKHIYDLMTANNKELISIRDVVRVFIHFMYFNCDIGKTK